MASEKLVPVLIQTMENCILASSEVDNSVLTAVIGILVNLAASVYGRDMILKPIPNCSGVCELLPMLLVNPPNTSDELLEMILHLFNNLAFEEDGANRLLKGKALPCLLYTSPSPRDA
eukprot:TRINITY_DN1606_c0_g1_i2.p1 TRINITY_DN1606_c0_g1~~TRINITY_DN1606_c0_g1_i2.p1  ORF type:complete len:118 (+),score=16.78 TRINITY_DN1606_c0_g1_i2:62-415(+)